MSGSIFPDDMRAQVRAQIAATKAPADQVDPIVDIAFHAAEQAVEAMQRVLNLAPSQAAENVAMGIAASLLKAAAETVQDALAAECLAHGGHVQRYEYQRPDGAA